MDLEDLEAALHVGSIEDDLAVEATGAQERRVEDVGSVGGGHDDDVRVRVEAVHLDEDLVQRLLALVVRAAQAGAALAADRVDLVDEHDARAVALGLVEEVAHAAGADAHEHLHELGAADAEEGHAGLARDRAREERLAGAGRPDEEHAARDARPERVELLGVLEELDDLLELHLGLIDAGHVRERHDRLVAEEHPGPALAEAHRLVVAALRLAEHEVQEHADEQDRQHRGQEDPEEGVAVVGGRAIEVRDRAVTGGFGQRAHLDHVRAHIGVELARDERLQLRVLVGVGDLQLDLELVAALDDLLDLAGFDHGEERTLTAVADLLDRVLVEQDEVEQRRGPYDQHEGDETVAHEPVVQGESLPPMRCRRDPPSRGRS